MLCWAAQTQGQGPLIAATWRGRLESTNTVFIAAFRILHMPLQAKQRGQSRQVAASDALPGRGWASFPRYIHLLLALAPVGSSLLERLLVVQFRVCLLDLGQLRLHEQVVGRRALLGLDLLLGGLLRGLRHRGSNEL